MPEPSFRVFFDGTSAPAEDLARVEEITIEQTEDAAWEARLVMSLSLDEQGKWALQEDIQLQPRTQVRIELKIGTDDFKPLIEGPIVGMDTAMDARPGRSTATVVVHDDSAWLNLESAPVSSEGLADDQIASELFTTKSQGHVPQTQIEISNPSAPPSLGSQFAQLGTPMQILRHLAERNGCRAYVLPGAALGQSIGCLKPDPEAPGTLPPLVLLGSSRNISELTVTEDPESSERTTIHTLRLGDQELVSYTTELSDETLLDKQPAAPAAPVRIAPPRANDSEDPAGRARARARLVNFPVKFTGRAIPGAYPKLLQPYEKIARHAGGGRSSTVMLLTKVTHHITPSMYTVEFEGRGNAFAELQSAESGVPAGIF
jgi:hypothetical protein